MLTACLRTIRKVAPGMDRKTAVRLRSEIVRLYEQNQIAEAADAARQLVDWQLAILGESHPDYARGLVNLSLLRRKQGDAGSATELLERAAAIRHAVLGSSHPDTLETEALLAALSSVGSPVCTTPAADTPLATAVGTPADDAPRMTSQAPEASAPIPVVPDAVTTEAGPGRVGIADRGSETCSTPVEAFAAGAPGALTAGPADCEPQRDSDDTPRVRPNESRDVLAVLEMVLSLEHVGSNEPDEFRTCLEAARELHAALGTRRADLIGIQADETDGMLRAFTALMALTDQPSTLNDRDWSQAYGLVAAAFGQTLASHASRGRLRERRGT